MTNNTRGKRTAKKKSASRKKAKSSSRPKKKASEQKPQHRDIFLSHRSANKDFVRKLARDIESSEGGKKLFAWLDEAEVSPGESIPGSIEKGLTVSRFFAVIMTPDYFDTESSGWTDAEWHAILHADPDNRKGRILPILAEDCPCIPYLLRHLNAIDLREKNYKSGLDILLKTLRNHSQPRPTTHRGQLVTPGGRVDRASLYAERAVPAADPDVINEKLYCNLLPVERLPKYVFIAPLLKQAYLKTKDGKKSYPTKDSLRYLIFDQQAKEGIERPYSPAFRLHEGKIFSFHEIEDSPLSAIADPDDTESIETKDLLGDENTRRIVISLLNMAIARHCAKVGLEIDRTKFNRFFFKRKNESDGINEIRWKPKKSWATRTVAKPLRDKDDKIKFWVHQGAYLKMMFLANRLYLQIKPTWVLTRDGVEVLQGPSVSKIINRYTGAERNHQILYHVRFWTTNLKRSKGLLSMRAGDQTIDFSTIPAFVDQSYGISDDNTDALGLLDREAVLFAQREDELIESLPDLTSFSNTTDSDEESLDGESYNDE